VLDRHLHVPLALTNRSIAACAAETLLAQKAKAILCDFDERTAVLPAHAIGLRCALDRVERDGRAFRGEPRGHVAEAETVVRELVGVVVERIIGDGDEGGRAGDGESRSRREVVEVCG
jgi:hypothetical protein